MLAIAEISFVLSISIYIIQNFNCQVKNYFWIAYSFFCVFPISNPKTIQACRAVAT